MLKLTMVVLAVALAGSASAAGWRSLRVDAGTEAAFKESVATFQEKLPRVRKAVFERSLHDIWAEGTKAAQAGEREYTMSDYLRQVDGLSYQEVVKFTDPTGDTAERYFDQAYANLYRGGNARPGSIQPNWGSSPGVSTFSGSKILDAGQSFRAEGRLGGNHH
jgi:hypothetical protein